MAGAGRTGPVGCGLLCRGDAFGWLFAPEAFIRY